MDHLMNNELSLEFGQSYARIPLKQSPHIRCADALEMDWEDLLPAEDCSFVFGNPPFVGSQNQSPEQGAQVRRIVALEGTRGTLDYVACWFMTAGQYIQKGNAAHKRARIGFVATNSITQGEQVGKLWPILFGRCELEIAFAHRTFEWISEARGMPHVHVVILGPGSPRAGSQEPEAIRIQGSEGRSERERACRAVSVPLRRRWPSGSVFGCAEGDPSDQRNATAEDRCSDDRQRDPHVYGR